MSDWAADFQRYRRPRADKVSLSARKSLEIQSNDMLARIFNLPMSSPGSTGSAFGTEVKILAEPASLHALRTRRLKRPPGRDIVVMGVPSLSSRVSLAVFN